MKVFKIRVTEAMTVEENKCEDWRQHSSGRWYITKQSTTANSMHSLEESEIYDVKC